MIKLPATKPKKLLSFLLKRGFYIHRQTGSHIVLKNNFGKRTTVPFHGKDLKMNTLKNILTEAGIPLDDLLNN